MRLIEKIDSRVVCEWKEILDIVCYVWFIVWKLRYNLCEMDKVVTTKKGYLVLFKSSYWFLNYIIVSEIFFYFKKSLVKRLLNFKYKIHKIFIIILIIFFFENLKSINESVKLTIKFLTICYLILSSLMKSLNNIIWLNSLLYDHKE